MGKVKYDEFRLAKRHKIAYQTLIMLFVMVGLNGYVKSNYGVWAEPFVEALVLIYIPGFYFAGASVWKNAYLRLHDNLKVILTLFGLTAGFGLFSLGASIFSGTFVLIENGQLSGSLGLVLMTALFTMLFVLLIVRRVVDRE